MALVRAWARSIVSLLFVQSCKQGGHSRCLRSLMNSRFLPGNPCFVLLPPKPCCKQVLMSVVCDSAANVAQQQDNKRLNNANWSKSLRHKQRLGVLDDGGVEVLAFYRPHAGIVHWGLVVLMHMQVGDVLLSLLNQISVERSVSELCVCRASECNLNLNCMHWYMLPNSWLL